MKIKRIPGSVEIWEKFIDTGLFYFLKQVWRGFVLSSNFSKLVDCLLISLGLAILYHDGVKGAAYMALILIILTQSWVLTVTSKDLDTTTGAFLRVIDILNKERRNNNQIDTKDFDDVDSRS